MKGMSPSWRELRERRPSPLQLEVPREKVEVEDARSGVENPDERWQLQLVAGVGKYLLAAVGDLFLVVPVGCDVIHVRCGIIGYGPLAGALRLLALLEKSVCLRLRDQRTQ